MQTTESIKNVFSQRLMFVLFSLSQYVTVIAVFFQIISFQHDIHTLKIFFFMGLSDVVL